MSLEDRVKWEQRYRDDSYRKNNPVELLYDWLPKIKPGRALDIACGAGRNAIYAAEQGFRVDAIDISAAGLERARLDAEQLGFEINWIEHDLDESYEFDRDYDLIMVLWYVNLPLIERLGACLAPGGYLICQEHLRVDAEVIGPQTPAFRVAPGTLREAAAGLEILHYAEAIEPADDDGQIASARLVARNN